MNILRFLFSFCMVLLMLPASVKGQEFKFKKREASVMKTATAIKAHNGFADTLIVRQDKWDEIRTIGSTWKSNLKFKKVEAAVKFSVDHAFATKIAQRYTFKLVYTVFGYTNPIDTNVYTQFNDTLTISYHPDSLSIIQDKQYKVYNGYHKMMVILKALYKMDPESLTAPPVLEPMTAAGTFSQLNFNVEATISVEPFHKKVKVGSSYVDVYGMDAPALVASSDAIANNFLPVRWALAGGSATTPIELMPVKYELEWTYADDYSVNVTTGAVTAKTAATTIYNFNNNSTRVLLDTNYYKIPVTYQRGYVLYRVRMVRPDSSAYRHPVYGKWSLANASGTVTSAGTANYKYNSLAHKSDSLNWQYTVSFAEDGKFKHVMSYYDGLLKNRQSITRINSDPNYLIATSQVYDYEGRPAISVLPTPVQNSSFGFVQNLALSSATAKPYAALDFDLLSTMVCPLEVTPPALTPASGASTYYSATNPDKTGVQQFVPSAGGYPFVQTVFSPGYQDRVDKQGGAGAELQLGNNHITKNNYVDGDQLDLNRMFGLNIGKAGFYNKTVGTDPNGQTSLSFSDYKGNVVATSLIGIPDTVPHALKANTNVPGAGTLLEEDHIAGTIQSIVGNKIRLNKNFFNDVKGNSTIKYVYEFTPFHTGCSNSYLSIASEFMYHVHDECGVERVSDKATLGVTGVVTSAAMASYTSPVKSFFMEKGEHSLFKELTVDYDAIDRAVTDFMGLPKSRNCLKSLNSFIRAAVNAKTFPCPSSSDNYCDQMKEAMMKELYPNLNNVSTEKKYGVYYTDGALVTAGPNSIFTKIGTHTYRYQDNCVTLPESITYMGVTYTNLKDLDPLVFIEIFNDEIAERLLPLHPEYCRLLDCIDDVYERQVQALPDYLTAQGVGMYEIDSLIKKDPIYKAMLLLPSAYPSPLDTLGYNKALSKKIKRLSVEMAYCESFDGNMQEDCMMNMYATEIAGSILINEHVKKQYFENNRKLYLGNRDNYKHLLSPAGSAAGCAVCQPIRMTLIPPSVFTSSDGGDTGWGDVGDLLEPEDLDYLDYFSELMPGDPSIDIDAYLDTATATLGAAVSALCTGSVNHIMKSLLNCELTVAKRNALRDTLMNMCISGRVAFSNFEPHHIQYALTVNGVTQDDLCNKFLVNYQFHSPNMASQSSGLSCATNAIYTNTETSINGKLLTALKTLGTTYSYTLSAANLFENNIIAKIGGTAGRFLGSYDAAKQTYRVKVFRVGGLDTVSVYFKGLEEPGTIFNTPTGTTTSVIKTDCFTGVTNFGPRGLVGTHVFYLEVSKVTGTTTQIIPAYGYVGKMDFANLTSSTMGNCVPCTEMKSAYKKFTDTMNVLGIKGLNHPYYSTVLRNFMNITLKGSYTLSEYENTIIGCGLADSMSIVDYNYNYATLTFTTAAQQTAFYTAINFNDTLNIKPLISYSSGTTFFTAVDFSSIPVSMYRLYRNFIRDYATGVKSINASPITGNVVGKMFVPTFGGFTPNSATIFSGLTLPLTFDAPSAVTNVKFGSDAVAIPGKWITVSNPTGATNASTSKNIARLHQYLGDNYPSSYFFNFRHSTVNEDYDEAMKKDYLAYVYGKQSLRRSNVMDSIQPAILKAKIASMAAKNMSYGNPFRPNAVHNLYITEAADTIGSFYNKARFIIDKVKAKLGSNRIFFTGSATLSIYTSGTEQIMGYRCSDGSYWYRYFGADDSLFNLFIKPPLYLDATKLGTMVLASYSLNPGDEVSRSLKMNLTHSTMPGFTLEVNAFTDFTVGKTKVYEDVLLPPYQHELKDADTVNNCERTILKNAIIEGKTRYAIYIDSVRNKITNDFTHHLMNGGIQEKLIMSYATHRFNYTLYNYDRAGNLIRTVPPGGANMLGVSLLETVNSLRNSGTENISYLPAHTKVSTYEYNTTNQVTKQKTPDGGEMQFFYDAAGRVVFSQNAVQRPTGMMSYTLYDEQGRIIETGQAKLGCDYFTGYTVPLGVMTATSCAYMSAETGIGYVTPFPSMVLFSKNRTNQQINNHVRGLVRKEVVVTHYDTAAFDLNAFVHLNTQENLRKRVSSIKYLNHVNAKDTLYKGYQYATHFSYDIAGNVKTLVRDYPSLSSINQRFKRVDYDYDVISGKVNMLSYNRSYADQYFQQYDYDADNRIKVVKTSADGIIWNEDARYDYYKHGPLARTSYGDLRVQGVDYAYTIQGWLKSMNGDILDTLRDMGSDGTVASVHAQDAVAFSLSYFDKDYAPIGTKKVNYIAHGGKNLYNGNIVRTNAALKPFENMNTRYIYDQLNRLLTAQYATVTESGGVATETATAKYGNKYSYDPDGNILSLVRAGNKAVTAMDSLLYTYTSGNNQLSNVRDFVNDTYDNDIKKFTTATTRYTYDGTGNLTKDLVSGLDSFKWSMYGKILSLSKIGNNERCNLHALYPIRVSDIRSGGCRLFIDRKGVDFWDFYDGVNSAFEYFYS